MQFDQKRRDPITIRSDAAVWPQTNFVTKLINLRSEFVLAAGLAGLALLLRLHGLSDKPFWYDEILTWGRAKLPLAELVVTVFKHKHFPTYFLLVGPFYSAHSPEWMLRFPSALFGAACVFLVTRYSNRHPRPASGLSGGAAHGAVAYRGPVRPRSSPLYAHLLLGADRDLGTGADRAASRGSGIVRHATCGAARRLARLRAGHARRPPRGEQYDSMAFGFGPGDHGDRSSCRIGTARAHSQLGMVAGHHRAVLASRARHHAVDESGRRPGWALVDPRGNMGICRDSSPKRSICSEFPI